MSHESPHRFDVVVAVRDPASALAALDCARVGLRVAVLDFPHRALPVEHPRRNGTVETVCERLGLGTEVVALPPGDENILGIPANAFAPGVRSRLGGAGAWRVYLDRLMPVMRIGNEPGLERLVTRRLGRRAWSLLVRPRCAQLCGDEINVSELNVADVAPGLSEAMSRVGSLTLGVVELMAADVRAVQTVTITGGVEALWAAIGAQWDFFAVTRIAVRGEHSIMAARDDPSRTTLTVTPTEIPNTSGVERPKRLALLTSVYLSDDVGLGPRFPTLDRAIEASARAAEQARRQLLSDVDNPPVGPVDLEG